MLKKAKERGEIVVQADLENLPFKNISTILSFTALQNVPDIKKAIAELRKLNPKKLIITYLDKFDLVKEVENQFDIQEIRKVGEDVCLVSSHK